MEEKAGIKGGEGEIGAELKHIESTVHPA